MMKKISRILCNTGVAMSCRTDILASMITMLPGYAMNTNGHGITRLGPFKIEYERKDTFRDLAIEIFLQQQYKFKTSTPSPIIIDAGANIGMSTLYFIMEYPAARIEAFEPSPSSYKLLINNIRRNKHMIHGEITLHQKALSKTEGEIEMYTKGAGCAQDSIYQHMCNGTKITVQSTRLSTTIMAHPKIDFLKMDVEGAETDIVEDLCKTGMIERIEQFAIEYHHKRGARLGKFVDMLEQHFDVHMSTSYSGYENEEYQGYVVRGFKKKSYQWPT